MLCRVKKVITDEVLTYLFSYYTLKYFVHEYGKHVCNLTALNFCLPASLRKNGSSDRHKTFRMDGKLIALR